MCGLFESKEAVLTQRISREMPSLIIRRSNPGLTRAIAQLTPLSSSSPARKNEDRTKPRSTSARNARHSFFGESYHHKAGSEEYYAYSCEVSLRYLEKLKASQTAPSRGRLHHFDDILRGRNLISWHCDRPCFDKQNMA